MNRPTPEAALELIAASTRLLFTNGQTTERVMVAAKQMAASLGVKAGVFPSWGELAIRLEGDNRSDMIAAEPAGVDMHKVVATMTVVDEVRAGRMDAATAQSTLVSIAHDPPISLIRFAAMAAAGAVALSVIFGATHPLTWVLIALSAGAGACLRRWIAGISHNLFLQPLSAALLAGIAGAIAVRSLTGPEIGLIAVCPCMILVPGPHFLNGMIDLARARIALGLARLTYAGVITLMICTGLILGLALGGANLPSSAPSQTIPLGYDVLAAGVAVAAYGTFFSMSWRMLPIPVLIGMLAHGLRWGALNLGASPVLGALVACLVVGLLAAPISDRMRLPFAGLAFASVVSLIPGVFLFRMAGSMVEFVTQGPQAPAELLTQIAFDGTTAFLIILAMAFGLIFPRMCIDWH